MSGYLPTCLKTCGWGKQWHVPCFYDNKSYFKTVKYHGGGRSATKMRQIRSPLYAKKSVNPVTLICHKDEMNQVTLMLVTDEANPVTPVCQKNRSIWSPSSATKMRKIRSPSSDWHIAKFKTLVSVLNRRSPSYYLHSIQAYSPACISSAQHIPV